MEHAKLEKLTKLIHYGAALDEICAIVGGSQEQVQTLIESAEVQNKLAELKLNAIETSETRNTGWDAVEEQALAQVLEKLQSVPDPDYALKAAMIANKAQRRNAMHENTPIQPQVNMQTVINLHPRFVRQVQKQGFEINADEKPQIARKMQNFLQANRVQKLLQKDEMSEIVDMLPA